MAKTRSGFRSNVNVSLRKTCLGWLVAITGSDSRIVIAHGMCYTIVGKCFTTDTDLVFVHILVISYVVTVVHSEEVLSIVYNCSQTVTELRFGVNCNKFNPSTIVCLVDVAKVGSGWCHIMIPSSRTDTEQIVTLLESIL